MSTHSSCLNWEILGARRGPGLTNPLLAPLELLEQEKRRVRGVKSDRDKCSLKHDGEGENGRKIDFFQAENLSIN